MKSNLFILATILLIFSGCSKEEGVSPYVKSGKLDQSVSASATKTTSYLVGDPLDVTTTTYGGICLMGGGKDVDAAFKWMIKNSGGGDFVVIRFDGSTGYNSYVYKMGGVNSVETVLITSVEDANNPAIYNKVRNAEALFIAGGDQANYVNFWKDTQVEEAINYLTNTKKVPVGGTSAGCAIMGSSYFSALVNTVTSEEAMADPYNPLITLGHDDFISAPYLQNTITDQHFSQRAREGRLVTFMARMLKARIRNPRGIAVDEQTAACIDQNGVATVFGANNAFFLQSAGGVPEVCAAGSPLTWNNDMQAVKVYRIPGGARINGNGSFDLKDYTTAAGGTWLWFYVQSGAFFTN